jgi:glucosamine-6-phosphate deaminase
MRPAPTRKLQFDLLPAEVFETNEAMGLAAALDAREVIQAAIASKGLANLILATGNSQLTFLHALRDLDGIEWSKVNVFHMDDYIHLDPNHRASFPLFLRRHILDAVKPAAFYPVPGYMQDVDQACREYEALLREHPTDLVAMGFGENGHLAFNDPPMARFFDRQWVKVVQLEETSRRQQWKEGHFDTLEEVPTQAISLTIPALLQSARILCIVPEARKAESVRACLCEPISEDRPGSILRVIKNAVLYLDQESAAKV